MRDQIRSLGNLGVGSFYGTYLFKEAPFLDDIRNSFHLYTLGLVDVLESIQIPGLFMLNDTDLDVCLS